MTILTIVYSLKQGENGLLPTWPLFQIDNHIGQYKNPLAVVGCNASGLIFSWVSGRLLFGVFGFIPTGIGGPTTVLAIVATVLFFRGRASVG